MPHQCTSCGRVFADGSKEMLSGCPECGGKKFQFRPSGASTAPDSDSRASPGSSPASSERDPGSSTTERESTLPTAEREPTPPESNRIEHKSNRTEHKSNRTEHKSDPSENEPAGYADESTTAGSTRPSPGASADEDGNDGEVVQTGERSDPPEDRAQANARSGFVSEEELSRVEEPSTARSDTPTADADSSTEPEPQDVERPDLAQLREELNSQFESIKIVSQGQYELNLMELYDRQEYIISLQEDGRYVIEMPDAWGPDDE